MGQSSLIRVIRHPVWLFLFGGCFYFTIYGCSEKRNDVTHVREMVGSYRPGQEFRTLKLLKIGEYLRNKYALYDPDNLFTHEGQSFLLPESTIDVPVGTTITFLRAEIESSGGITTIIFVDVFGKIQVDGKSLEVSMELVSDVEPSGGTVAYRYRGPKRDCIERVK